MGNLKKRLKRLRKEIDAKRGTLRELVQEANESISDERSAIEGEIQDLEEMINQTKYDAEEEKYQSSGVIEVGISVYNGKLVELDHQGKEKLREGDQIEYHGKIRYTMSDIDDTRRETMVDLCRKYGTDAYRIENDSRSHRGQPSIHRFISQGTDSAADIQAGYEAQARASPVNITKRWTNVELYKRDK